MENLKNEVKSGEKAQLQHTENGAVGYSTSGKHLLDMNFRVSSYRSMSPDKITNDFIKAFNEDKNLAIKWLYFARDVREGLGERNLFRACIHHLFAANKSEMAEELIKAISEYGRWDDIFSVFGTQYEDLAIKEIERQLLFDVNQIDNGGKNSVSLLAKWMPRENTSNKDRVAFAKYLRGKLKMEPAQYRKTLSKINKYLKTIEVSASAKEWDKINYEQVPSLANLKYKNAFLRNDEDRRREYLGKLEKGEAKINMAVGFPHDIVHSYVKDGRFGWRYSKISVDQTLEAAWKALPSFDIANTLVVGDSSGSMTVEIGNSKVQAIEVAHALGIYCGDHCSGPFKNKMITFSENPKYLEWKDNDTLANKLNIAFSHSEVANTNIEKVFELILNTAVKNHCSQEDMPRNILIISDMEFDNATDGHPDKTLFDDIAERYESKNYKLPRLIFWNVNSRTLTVPIQENEMGAALVSGFSVNVVKMVMSEKLDAFEALKDILMGERYKRIIWE
jgi:hypothetical protein